LVSKNLYTKNFPDKNAFHSNYKIDENYKPLISVGNVTRYFINPEVEEYIKYGDWLGAMRNESFFMKPRIIIRQIVSGKPPRIYAGYSEQPLYFTQIGFGLFLLLTLM
jgi:hypothetical protein